MDYTDRTDPANNIYYMYWSLDQTTIDSLWKLNWCI